jgi:hypothetical protein
MHVFRPLAPLIAEPTQAIGTPPVNSLILPEIKP